MAKRFNLQGYKCVTSSRLISKTGCVFFAAFSDIEKLRQDNQRLRKDNKALRRMFETSKFLIRSFLICQFDINSRKENKLKVVSCNIVAQLVSTQ